MEQYVHSWDFHWRGSSAGDIFQEEVSLNRSNHSTTVQIFQRIQKHSK